MTRLDLEILFLELFEDCKTEKEIENRYDKLQALLDYAYDTTIDELEDGE